MKSFHQPQQNLIIIVREKIIFHQVFIKFFRNWKNIQDIFVESPTIIKEENILLDNSTKKEHFLSVRRQRRRLNIIKHLPRIFHWTSKSWTLVQHLDDVWGLLLEKCPEFNFITRYLFDWCVHFSKIRVGAVRHLASKYVKPYWWWYEGEANL